MLIDSENRKRLQQEQLMFHYFRKAVQIEVYLAEVQFIKKAQVIMQSQATNMINLRNICKIVSLEYLLTQKRYKK